MTEEYKLGEIDRLQNVTEFWELVALENDCKLLRKFLEGLGFSKALINEQVTRLERIS